MLKTINFEDIVEFNSRISDYNKGGNREFCFQEFFGLKDSKFVDVMIDFRKEKNMDRHITKLPIALNKFANEFTGSSNKIYFSEKVNDFIKSLPESKKNRMKAPMIDFFVNYSKKSSVIFKNLAKTFGITKWNMLDRARYMPLPIQQVKDQDNDFII